MSGQEARGGAVDGEEAVQPASMDETGVEDPGNRQRGRLSFMLRPCGLALVALAVLLGIWIFSRVARPKAGQGGSLASSVALQGSDFGGSFLKCPYSGGMDSYMSQIKLQNPDTYEAVAGQWKTLRDLGATEGYAAFFSNLAGGCETIITGAIKDLYPRVAFSFVIRFPTNASAEAAYRADVFGSAKMRGDRRYQIFDGDTLKLGPNAVIGQGVIAYMPVLQAAWQGGSYDVLFGSQNVAPPESSELVRRINSRIPRR